MLFRTSKVCDDIVTLQEKTSTTHIPMLMHTHVHGSIDAICHRYKILQNISEILIFLHHHYHQSSRDIIFFLSTHCFKLEVNYSSALCLAQGREGRYLFAHLLLDNYCPHHCIRLSQLLPAVSTVLRVTSPLCLPSLNCSESVSGSVVSASLWPPWTIAHQAPLSMGFSRQE